MMFAMTMKDIIYATVYILTVASFIFTQRGKVKALEKSSAVTKSVLFKEDATLNIINVENCKTHRDTIHEQIHRESAETNKALERIDRTNNKVDEKIEKINSNILKIAFHMGVELKD